ncbi:MAG: DUF4936 family protein [Burkholderiaceae bacterium]
MKFQHWYVYYKVPSDMLSDVVTEVRQMQDTLAQTSGVRGRLLARNSESVTTLMEIYERIDKPEGFAAMLDQAVSNSSLSTELRVARRTERFQDI